MHTVNSFTDKRLMLAKQLIIQQHTTHWTVFMLNQTDNYEITRQV